MVLLAGLWPALGPAQTGALVPEREALRERVEALRNDARSPIGAGRREARALIAGLYESRARD